jgi:ppGpp synthetase/RelA/SpoT-type nucleotidyltranferase
MTWTTPKYKKSEVDKAGETLKKETVTNSEIGEALIIMNNWRSSHSFPMHIFKKRLSTKAKKIDKTALVVQRLKRSPSIIKKLHRGQTQTMKLSQMQDIGGCRAVLANVKLVKRLTNLYIKSRGLKHKRVNYKDYIQNPKQDGYRGVHLIYKYKSDKKNTYDGLLIEIQMRSQLQHAWATTVETVDLFTRQAIKSNEGEDNWKDFFRLVSSAFAKMESEPLVPNTPQDSEVLLREIKEKVNLLKIFPKMERWTRAIRRIEPEMKKLHFFLLELDVTEGKERIEIMGYPKEAEPAATEDYLKMERAQGEDPNKDVVLVAADSIDELRKAYPNYFIDTTMFLEYLKSSLSRTK